MREVIICFVIAIIFGAAYNSYRQMDWWGTEENPTNMAAVVPLVEEGDFEKKVTQAQGPILVEFYSDDSQQCKVMVPIIASVARKLHGQVTVLRADAVDSPMISKLYGIGPVPDFVLFNGGEKISHVAGQLSDSELIDFVKHSLDGTAPEVQTNNPKPAPEPAKPSASTG
jgi:thioredoxin 1